MRCDDFRHRLAEYLRGELREPFFGEMADHEAECADCQALACAIQAGEESAGEAPAGTPDERSAAAGGAPSAGSPPAFSTAARSLLDSVLAGTSGADCLYMEQRLSERVDGPLTAELEAHLWEHLAGCASCRRLRDVLEELPSFYAALPSMRADHAFTRRVLQRTVGRQPGFFDVVRELLRQPETIWEALVSMLVFSPSPVRTGSAVQSPPVSAVQAGLRGVGDLLFDGISQAQSHASGWSEESLKTARSAWSRFLGEMAGVSNWMQRTGEDLRSGNTGGLLLDLDPVLRPLHLTSPRPGPKPAKPETRP